MMFLWYHKLFSIDKTYRDVFHRITIDFTLFTINTIFQLSFLQCTQGSISRDPMVYLSRGTQFKVHNIFSLWHTRQLSCSRYKILHTIELIFQMKCNKWNKQYLDYFQLTSNILEQKIIIFILHIMSIQVSFSQIILQPFQILPKYDQK